MSAPDDALARLAERYLDLWERQIAAMAEDETALARFESCLRGVAGTALDAAALPSEDGDDGAA